MKIPRKARSLGDVDVTAFSDLAFLLIVFFVLTTTFIKPQGARITIPSSTTDAEAKPEQELPTINLSAEQMLLNQQSVSIEELRRRLKKMKLPAKKEEERAVILEATGDVDYQRYYHVVTAISQAGGVLALVETPEQKNQGQASNGQEP